MKSFAWSHSALTSFEQCPKRHYLTKVSKLVQEPETDAMAWGKRVHKAFEDFLQKDIPFSHTMEGFTDIASYFKKKADSADEFYVECQWAIDMEKQPVDWFAPDVWCRSIADLVIIRGNRAMAVDWKTGKRKPDFDQLTLLALFVFILFPEVDDVRGCFAWLKDDEIDVKRFRREKMDDYWQDFLPRVERMEEAFNFDNWPARPSGLCRNYCPVGKRNCSHCGG